MAALFFFLFLFFFFFAGVFTLMVVSFLFAREFSVTVHFTTAPFQKQDHRYNAFLT